MIVVEDVPGGRWHVRCLRLRWVSSVSQWHAIFKVPSLYIGQFSLIARLIVLDSVDRRAIVPISRRAVRNIAE